MLVCVTVRVEVIPSVGVDVELSLPPVLAAELDMKLLLLLLLLRTDDGEDEEPPRVVEPPAVGHVRGVVVLIYGVLPVFTFVVVLLEFP